MSDHSHNVWNTELFYNSLKTRDIGRKLVYMNITGSTMDDARKLGREVSEYPHGTVLIAERQTKARGARDHVWDASNTGNIYASFILHEPSKSKSFEGKFHLEVASSLSVLAAAKKLGFHDVKTKWPNDVWINNKKLAGNLAEDGKFEIPGNGKSLMILGIGINVNADTKNNQELCSIATSLRCENNMECINRESFFADVCLFLEKYLNNSSDSLKLKEFKEQNVFQPNSSMSVSSASDGTRYNATFVDIYDNWDIGFIDIDSTEVIRGRSDKFTCRPKPT